MKKTILFLLSIFLLVSFASCKGDNETLDSSVVEGIEETENTNIADAVSINSILGENIQQNYSVDEPLVFDSSLTKENISRLFPKEEYAVVGSDVCFLMDFNAGYDETSMERKAIDDVFSIKEKIPCGTILEIEKKLENPDQESGLVYYQENYNWFYKVNFNGKSGYVFGSDLDSFSSDCGIEETVSVSNLYKLDGNPSGQFFPIVRGINKNREAQFISANVKKSLEKNNLAFEKVLSNDYYLSAERPDDMVSLYSNLSEMSGSKTPVFITTDFLAHCQHLFFDRTLQKLEEEEFAPRLLSLIDSYLGKLTVYTQDLNDEYVLSLSEKAKDYLLVAKYFLAKSVSAQPIALESLSSNCQKEILNIEAGAGLSSSAIFPAYKEDYSQYKPRGHYTKTETLKNYFISQMWFGRINFIIADSKGANPDLEAATKDMAPVALLLIDLTSKDEKLFSDWQYLFDPITDLIGDSDDLSFYELTSIWKDQKVKKFSSWIKNEKNLDSFLHLCHEKLEPPAISGNSVFYAPYEAGHKPPMGWKLLGQRFTYDSAIHHAVSSPRLYGRMMVSGLDIMAAFGSNFAHDLLNGDSVKEGFTQFKDFPEILSGFKAFFDSKDSSFWNKNYYNSILNQIRSLAKFESSNKFYFTKSPLWNLKSISSALGTWSELRHDTILYVKQSYAEMGGGAYISPTYRVKKLQQQISYIEPNEEFFKSSIDSLEVIRKIDDKYKILGEEVSEKLNSLSTIYQTCLDLVQKEERGDKLSSSDDEWIRTIPQKLATIVLLRSNTYGIYAENTDCFKMSVVADVYTNIEIGSVLEVGVGKPKRIYVALNDVNGKRIAVGYSFDYYEFENGMNRLTDETWKQMVYAEDFNSASYKPNWLNKLEEN